MDEPLTIVEITTTILNNAQIILALLIVVMVAACFLGRYVVLTKKLVLSSLGLLLLDGILTVVLNLFFQNIDEEYILIIQYITSALTYVYGFVFYLLAFKEKKVVRAIEATVCFYVLTLYISTFSQLIVVYALGGTDDIVNKLFFRNIGVGPEWLAIMGLSFLITLALFLIVFFGFYKPKKYFVIGIPYRILFVIWTVLFIIIPFFPSVIPSSDITIDYRYHMMSIMFAFGIFILGLAVPVIMIIATAERSLKEKNKSQEAYLAAELEYIGQYKKTQVETKAFRHDIKNNLAMTQMMLESGHTDEAREHISDMLGRVSALSPKYVTGDEMLDLIISMKADKMDEMNIKFTLDGVTDGGLNIKPMDMCSVFANALDNAIEAASKCEDPFVTFNIKRTDKFFVIKITNSAAKKIDAGKLLATSGYTSKSDKDHHGFGLMNVRRTVEDYDGILKAESEDKSFTLSIMLPRNRG
ncbi:MAG: GHKL domain-containing protein [Saccharofermentans sp.]|nr:GHKL domain-containing protein [Saccharofermentans sp.]